MIITKWKVITAIIAIMLIIKFLVMIKAIEVMTGVVFYSFKLFQQLAFYCHELAS